MKKFLSLIPRKDKKADWVSGTPLMDFYKYDKRVAKYYYSLFFGCFSLIKPDLSKIELYKLFNLNPH